MNIKKKANGFLNKTFFISNVSFADNPYNVTTPTPPPLPPYKIFFLVVSVIL